MSISYQKNILQLEQCLPFWHTIELEVGVGMGWFWGFFSPTQSLSVGKSENQPTQSNYNDWTKSTHKWWGVVVSYWIIYLKWSLNTFGLIGWEFIELSKHVIQ